MSITIDDIKDYHLDSDYSITQLDTLEINHSTWAEPIRIVINHDDGITATLETAEVVFFEFAPVLIKKGNTSDDLDQSLSITLGDLGETLPPLIKQIRQANSDERPSVIYRAYAFNAATRELAKSTPLDVIKGLYIRNMNRDFQGSTFEAKTTEKNTASTGRTFNMQDYPDQKALL